MPKGQYPRKPRNVAPDGQFSDAEKMRVNRGEPSVIGGPDLPAAPQPLVMPADEPAPEPFVFNPTPEQARVIAEEQGSDTWLVQRRTEEGIRYEPVQAASREEALAAEHRQTLGEMMGEVPSDVSVPYERSMIMGFYQPPDEAARDDMAQRLQDTARTPEEQSHADEMRARPITPPQPKRDNFDDWAEEDAPVIPADNMVTRKVHAWAGTVCNLRHDVTWQPEDDGASIEVLLVTDHGATRLKKPAGNWTEPDIDAALQAMRDELMV